jgi:hypothetical protein
MIDRGTSRFATPKKPKGVLKNFWDNHQFGIGVVAGGLAVGSLMALNSRRKPKHTNLTIPKADYVIPGVQPTMYPNYHQWKMEERERNKKYRQTPTPTPTPVMTPSEREPLEL